MSTIPHLNSRPSPNWILPFTLAVLTSLVISLAINGVFNPQDSRHAVVESLVAALSATFAISIMTTLWVAVRGSNRQFYPSMRTRVSIVGLFCPLVIVGIWQLFDYIGYGTPTNASPGLEMSLLSSLFLGEALVVFASHPVKSPLENAG